MYFLFTVLYISQCYFLDSAWGMKLLPWGCHYLECLFPISVTQPGIHFLSWHWILWMQINLKILFAFVRQFFPENESSILLSCLYLWEVGSSISMAVWPFWSLQEFFGWLVMPLVRAFDPEQQQLEDRLLVANRSNNSSLRLHYMAAMFCNWGIKKNGKDELVEPGLPGMPERLNVLPVLWINLPCDLATEIGASADADAPAAVSRSCTGSVSMQHFWHQSLSFCPANTDLERSSRLYFYANLQASWPARLLQWCDSKMFGAFSFRSILVLTWWKMLSWSWRLLGGANMANSYQYPAGGVQESRRLGF